MLLQGLRNVALPILSQPVFIRKTGCDQYGRSPLPLVTWVSHRGQPVVLFVFSLINPYPQTDACIRLCSRSLEEQYVTEL